MWSRFWADFCFWVICDDENLTNPPLEIPDFGTPQEKKRNSHLDIIVQIRMLENVLNGTPRNKLHHFRFLRFARHEKNEPASI